MAAGSGMKSIVTALVANLGIAVAKFLGWLLTGSSSMLAEGVHSVADSSNQALLLLGGRRATRKASEVHQFGYGRVRYVAAFVVSIVLFTLGGLFAIYEAWHKFSDPHPITDWQWVPIVVLVLAVVLESFALRTALKEGAAVKGDRSWFRYLKESRSPEIPTIILEDTGALLGLVFGLFGVSMTLVTDDGRWDALGSGAIGVLLVVIAVFLAREMISMLIGESALPEHQAALERALVDGEDIERVIHMRTLHIGPDEVLVAAKVAVPAAETAADVARAVDAVEARARASVPLRLQIYVEPAPFEDGRSPAHDRETWEVDPAPEPPAAQGHAAEQE
ncbi:cation diffusion facilitator family transporter [Georgenia sp. Z1491]|uniref:cation diffusion facilitator family transporter n=1 Tax=Georgenia sp. Z1491 TaxID=3416707 RepID=UPI003CED61C4